MSYLEQYRPPGRSNRSGRANADNDVFEGLPVKQWNVSHARVSLAPPVQESENPEDKIWADPPMPRDYQLLNPWTQHLLRLARSGRVGTKRKQDADVNDEDKPEDEGAEEVTKSNNDERAYLAKKWKPVPEHMLEPEHKHFEFLAKRRRGLPSLYGPEQQNGAAVVMRKTKVQRADVNGEITVYEVLVPEGQVIEGEVTESTELADVKPAVAAPGTAIEGVGIANEEGVLVAEHLKPMNAPRRNRPPPKKKGGPGRGKKRVTFTNPDGTTYTTVVPNATKIVPQPGQTVKHVAKGEEATADISAEEAAKRATEQPEHGGDGEGEGEDGGSGSDEGDDDGDDDEDREEGMHMLLRLLRKDREAHFDEISMPIRYSHAQISSCAEDHLETLLVIRSSTDRLQASSPTTMRRALVPPLQQSLHQQRITPLSYHQRPVLPNLWKTSSMTELIHDTPRPY